MIAEQATTSPKLRIGVSAFLALGTFSTLSSIDTSQSVISYIDYVKQNESTVTPEISKIYNYRSHQEDLKELFPINRDFTNEELSKYNSSLDKLFKPTGINIFEI